MKRHRTRYVVDFRVFDVYPRLKIETRSLDLKKLLMAHGNSFLNLLKIKSGVLVLALILSFFNSAEARIIYSTTSGSWSATSTWFGGIVPVANDTVVIQDTHTVTNSANLYSNSTYMFLIVDGTLDLGNTGKLNFNGSSNVIVETGGRILGTGNGAQISIGNGGAE